MTRHTRIPAIAAISITILLGLGLMAATGQFHHPDLDHATLGELEKQVLGSTSVPVWMAYGKKLLQAGQYQDAAKAFDRVLELQPDSAEARLDEGLALGQGNDADAFFDFVGRLSGTYPKQAVELLARQEVSHMQSDPRRDPAQSAARAQAVD